MARNENFRLDILLFKLDIVLKNIVLISFAFYAFKKEKKTFDFYKISTLEWIKVVGKRHEKIYCNILFVYVGRVRIYIKERKNISFSSKLHDAFKFGSVKQNLLI